MAVTIKIQDSTGVFIKEFAGEDEKSFHEMADEHEVEIPIACGAGACLVCAVKVISGMEFVDPAKKQPALVDVEEGVTLTCIAGVKSEFISDAANHEIVLQKMY